MDCIEEAMKMEKKQLAERLGEVTSGAWLG